MSGAEDNCRSVLREERDGKPWNHLCILPVQHTNEHRCWHGAVCAVWDDAQSSDRAPRTGMGGPLAYLFTREQERGIA